jgi:predicted HicB family RNase H-like nuclease
MTDAERYAITVRKVRIEGEDLWRATVRELPDVAEFADTREIAISLATDAIESLMEDAKVEGRPFPEPIEDDDEYSGRVTVRLPKSVHRAVALQADEEGISINSYIIASLTYSVAERLRSLSRPATQRDLITYEASLAQKASHIVLAKYHLYKPGPPTAGLLAINRASPAISPYYGIPVQTESTSVVLATGAGGYYTTMLAGVADLNVKSLHDLSESEERKRA